MLTSLVYLQQGNVKKSKKVMKIVKINEENLHIFRTTGKISVKVSGKMFYDNIKSRKKKDLLSLQKITFWKSNRGCQKELRNCILCILRARSLFCSIRICISLYFLPILSKNQFFVFPCSIFYLFCFEFEFIFVDLSYNICRIIAQIGTKCSVILFSANSF